MTQAVETLKRAFQETEHIITAIKVEQLSNPTPCDEWDLRALLNHTISTIQVFTAALVGDLLPDDPNAEIIGDDPLSVFRQAAAAALKAWSQDGVLHNILTLPHMEMPAGVAIQVNLFDTYIHAWDIAQAIGHPIALDPELAAEALNTVKIVLKPEFRQPGGPFGPEVEVSESASVADQLLAFSGRQP